MSDTRIARMYYLTKPKNKTCKEMEVESIFGKKAVTTIIDKT